VPEKGLSPARIASTIADALTAKRRSVRYTVTPTPLLNLLLTNLPKRAIDPMLARRLGLTAGAAG
jgi:hypothetical protein